MKKLTLENGLRLILVPQETSLATTVLVLVETGSKYETKEINGLSHFLEHMCFKGTEQRPTAFAIASELDGIGASYNAFTGQEYTGYYAKARPTHFDQILDVVSDIYLHQKFDETEIEKEKGVIIEEINMLADLPTRKVQDAFMELMYGDQPAGWPIAGRKEVVQAMTRQHFIDYCANHYVADATIVVIAGKFDEQEAIEGVKKYFAGITTGVKSKKVKTTESQERPQVTLITKETDQTHLVMGMRAFDLFDERKYALDVLGDILGGGMSSRLFQKVREEMGAAYYIGSGADLSTDHGYMDVSAGIDHKKIDEVITEILKEVKRMAEELVTPEDLIRAKEHLIGGLVLGLETSNQLAGFYGSQEVLERAMMSPEELIRKTQEVTAEEIMAVAKDIVKNEGLNLAIIGPFKDKGRFEKILNF
ncbi:MAG: Peptidase M16 domain protein [Candidatus Wolfebacteria bacterium GW2011_GWE1_48_7]|uniref:Peptidase M16 domain protein n=2 Tax=Candidatus Wolfeibacteriota TaxID=1752735 RepID=A0A0G1U6Z5_9BACT|nr:MAG: processing protease [Candidatus Wolfebacteria bacterium GW2011_GWB1_47_1]KKU75657.1 MAG: Peptidase M16 domain protein [Candidatus Wolfebacteria bacterium GW2011_GWA1_47_6]KKU89897.1 MAG: Peptidase M16 domain protein [Candidatus Wolfebacteria bacterium GW2011_GWA2_47_9b]KKU98653.1 MAG: Peptidase M16 domain protein [Candidatus Wolfebacteria bacterium GW2011_GWE1_48_7]HBN87017.1 insulinase family protein [Candidatus Wolfebacteria bacterium]